MSEATDSAVDEIEEASEPADTRINKIEEAKSELDRFLQYLNRLSTRGAHTLQLNGLLVSVVVGLISYQGSNSDLGSLMNIWLISGFIILGVSTVLAFLTVSIGCFQLPIVSRSSSRSEREITKSELLSSYRNAIHRIDRRTTLASYTMFGGILFGFGSAPLLIAGFLSANEDIGFIFSNQLPIGALLFVVLLPVLTIGPIRYLRLKERQGEMAVSNW